MLRCCIDDGIISAVGRRDAVTVPANARVVDFGDAILDARTHRHPRSRRRRPRRDGRLRRGPRGHRTYDGAARRDQLLPNDRHGADGSNAERTRSFGQGCETCREQRPLAIRRARVRLGIHLEGPFLSHARRGVHPSLYLQPPSAEMFDQMWDAAAGRFVCSRIAPELEGALELIATSRAAACA